MSGLTGFSDLPLRVCIYLGAILALGAMSYGVWIIIKTLIEEFPFQAGQHLRQV